jgi:hypothetical protein
MECRSHGVQFTGQARKTRSPVLTARIGDGIRYIERMGRHPSTEANKTPGESPDEAVWPPVGESVPAATYSIHDPSAPHAEELLEAIDVTLADIGKNDSR